jgi:hypothetical protein
VSARFAQHAGRAPGVDACWEVHEGPASQTLVTADGAVDVVVRFEAGVPHLEVETICKTRRRACRTMSA